MRKEGNMILTISTGFTLLLDLEQQQIQWLIDSIPYIKDWITNHHPQAGNPNSILLCGFGKSLNRVISVECLHGMYQYYKNKFFTKLLDNPNVPDEDKQKIRELLKNMNMQIPISLLNSDSFSKNANISSLHSVIDFNIYPLAKSASISFSIFFRL